MGVGSVGVGVVGGCCVMCCLEVHLEVHCVVMFGSPVALNETSQPIHLLLPTVPYGMLQTLYASEGKTKQEGSPGKLAM